MQIEKHLFKISQRLLKHQNAKTWAKYIFYSLIVMSILLVMVIIYGHAIVANDNSDLSKCFKGNQVQIEQDKIYFVTDVVLSDYQKIYYEKNKEMRSTVQCSIIQNKNYTENYEEFFMFSFDPISFSLTKQKRSKLNYKNVTIILNNRTPFRKFIYSLNNLLINQIIDNPLGIFSLNNKKILIKYTSGYVFYEQTPITTLDKIIKFGKVILFYTIISLATSLYIYGTIIAAPAVILIILKVCRFALNERLNDVLKLFPWIGVHAIIRETSTTPIIKQSTLQICKAILFYFLFLYFVYYASIIWIDKHLFTTQMEYGFQEVFFGFIALAQFSAIIFIRTKTFIKYYPSFHSLIAITTLYYCQVHQYGFKKLVCYCGFSIAASLFVWMIWKLEIPAMTTWDRNNPNTPKQDRPRVGYFPLFYMGWSKSLPQEWTLLMPLFSRENFNTRELAYVDRNNELLVQVLGNNR